ncbi:hypothetical protein COP2_026616 [Malus domestica]
METKEGRSFIDKVIIKWYEDPEVLQMVKKRVSTVTAMMEIDSMKDITSLLVRRKSSGSRIQRSSRYRRRCLILS